MSDLKSQKRIASQILKVGESRVWINPSKDFAEEIKQAITREDIKRLIVKGVISYKLKNTPSRGRFKLVAEQKKKGRRKGQGNRKGNASARTPKKRLWIIKVRNQRELIKDLKTSEKLSRESFKRLYLLVKGGFFRSRSHLKTYVNDNNFIEKRNK